MTTGMKETLRKELENLLGSKIMVEKVEPAVEQGENYASDITRVRLKVLRPDGGCQTRRYIIKEEPSDPRSINIKKMGIMVVEIKIYEEVLPSMERLMSKVGLSDETLWAHCIGQFNNTLVLEDLQVLGYQTWDRARGFDYPHALLVVRRLAQFHALSVALEDMGELRSSDFCQFVFGGRVDHMNEFITSSFQYLHRVAAKEWSPEWKDIIENVGLIPEMAVEKLREITKLQEGGFHVLNHGDTWVNNIMFKDNDGVPESVKFVDFQLSHYNSYAFDLHYLLNTSLSTEVLHHIDRLYEEYHHHLTKELARLGRTDGPSPSDLCSELERTEFFGLFSAVSVAPVIMAKQEIVSPKDNTGYTLTELEQRKEDRYRTEEYTRRIQVILRRAQHGGLFKRLFM